MEWIHLWVLSEKNDKGHPKKKMGKQAIYGKANPNGQQGPANPSSKRQAKIEVYKMPFQHGCERADSHQWRKEKGETF